MSNETNSNTPMTDAEPKVYDALSCVHADFARQLERELNEADMLIERLFACAVAHMTHYNRTPFSDNFHPVHRSLWNETIDWQNRRALTKATFQYVYPHNTEKAKGEAAEDARSDARIGEGEE